MKVCDDVRDWILFFRSGRCAYGYVEALTDKADRMWSKTINRCSFRGTEDEVKEEVMKREREDGLRGGTRPVVGNPSYTKKRI